jgi:hypothetical protein
MFYKYIALKFIIFSVNFLWPHISRQKYVALKRLSLKNKQVRSVFQMALGNVMRLGE